VEGYIRRGYLASVMLQNTDENTRTGGGRAVDHSESDSEIGEGSDDYGSDGSDGYDADEYNKRGMYL